ncbi:MAG: homocysteine S-methyltransferase family protein [Oscillospiraceae bacterium]|jgi:5-methyltetrahydrofolate--homocysteine methyltransferase|nr:homocysteine S-methyltransferase family protein [Oscillospiraceae bacterium]
MAIILLDGAMGTMLQQAGLKPGETSEVMNIRNPKAVLKIHRAYAEAGARMLYTNTLCANALNLRGSGLSVREVIASGIELAHKAGDVKVALDVGPLGAVIAPPEEKPEDGELSFDAAYNLYAEQVALGAENGADYIVVETQYDLLEVGIALAAARDAAKLPVLVTMTFDETGRTFSGATPEDFAAAAEKLGAVALGLNCSLGPDEVFPIFRTLAGLTKLPLIAKPNAGLPNSFGEYDASPEDFAEGMRPFVAAGAKFVGGCCGTTPAFIDALRRALV